MKITDLGPAHFNRIVHGDYEMAGVWIRFDPFREREDRALRTLSRYLDRCINRYECNLAGAEETVIKKPWNPTADPLDYPVGTIGIKRERPRAIWGYRA